MLLSMAHMTKLTLNLILFLRKMDAADSVETTPFFLAISQSSLRKKSIQIQRTE